MTVGILLSGSLALLGFAFYGVLVYRVRYGVDIDDDVTGLVTLGCIGAIVASAMASAAALLWSIFL